MEFKGTKGKWTYIQRKGYNLAILISDTGDEICNFGNDYDYYPTQGIEPNEYDALLISKAPELLETLQMHVDALDLTDYDFYEKYGYPSAELMPRTRKLIKEATEID